MPFSPAWRPFGDVVAVGPVRFLTALGIGGEWAAGAALVAEVWPEQKRARAAGWLQSAWAAGFLLAAVLNLGLGQYGWRPLFVVGLFPAAVALLVRLLGKGAVALTRAREQATTSKDERLKSVPGTLQARLRARPLIGSGLPSYSRCSVMGRDELDADAGAVVPSCQGMIQTRSHAMSARGRCWLNAGALAGYLSFGPIADRFDGAPLLR